ncbi:MAG: translation initiation factor IF-3 [Bacteroidetes bacterium]|nr:translation initiation factor IF-3 [Bacteroidota bacterium]
MDEDGNPLGVMSSQEALRLATSRQLDLVEIAPNSKPPVCKIINYGKYNYERQKKEKQQKKNQSVMTVKEIRFNANTDSHDIDFKTKHLRQFLIDGHKIKATVLYKGRMITHPEIGKKLMDEVLEKLVDVSKLESSPKLEGKMLTAYLLPDKNKINALNAKLAKAGKAKEDKPAEAQTAEAGVEKAEQPAEEKKEE